MALPADNIATTTLQNIRREIADNIFLRNGTAAYFLMQGRVELTDGGKRIDEPLNYAVNSTVQSYSGYDLLDVSPTEEFTTAMFNWKQFAGSVSISGLEELENSGPPAIFNLIRQKVMVLEESLTQHLDGMIHNPITAKGPKDFLGFDEIIEDDDLTPSGVLGGIDRNVYTWWRNKVQEAGGVTPGTLTNLYSSMSKMYNECSKGISFPDLLVSPYREQEAFEDQNAGKQRLTNEKMMALGYSNFMFKGATWLTNESCIANRIYFLNTRYLRLKIHRRRNFVMTPFVTPRDQDARVALMLSAGNMTCNNSRFQGVLKTGA